MISWLQTYFSTIAALVILIAIVSAIVIRLIQNRKAGRSSYGCDCGSCKAACACSKK
ncbi:MAG: FeoB-associated Cys-rich membrane protein [Clostridia bacterium]|nr:FeoB-associated Cys-rich membrane protein [Clostridia bacterium]